VGNACKGILLRLQSCFLVVDSFSMFYVKRWLFLLLEVDVSRGTWKLQSPGKMIQLLKTLVHVTIPWRFGKAS